MKTIPYAIGWFLAVASAVYFPPIEAVYSQEAPPATGRSIDPVDPTLFYVGRWDKLDPASYGGKWIAAYLRTGFTGNSVGVKVDEHKTLDFAIDDGPIQTATGGPGVIPLRLPVSSANSHSLLVGATGGGGWKFQGLVLAAGGTTHVPAPRPLIEFIGDSITCGSPQPIEAAGNYSWLTAEAMGCDHTQIAWPGRALTTGFGCQDDKAGLDVQYFQENCFYDRPKMPWDFSAYTPEIVVINLGQNDQCGREPEADFLASYLSFVVNIRAKFPQARIVAMRPFSGSFAASIAKAVETLNARGDAAVHYVDTAGWLEPGDFYDGVHPNVAGHVKVADRLTRLLRALPDAPASPAKPPALPAVVGDPADPVNSGTQAAKEAGNMVDLDSDPTKLIEVVEVGKQLLMTRGALTTFSISNDVAKYFAILPAMFAAAYPEMNALNVMHLATPQSAILSAVIFNALIIIALIPLALRGVAYRPRGANAVLRENVLIYGLGGIIVPFIGIKAIDLILQALHLTEHHDADHHPTSAHHRRRRRRRHHPGTRAREHALAPRHLDPLHDRHRHRARHRLPAGRHARRHAGLLASGERLADRTQRQRRRIRDHRPDVDEAAIFPRPALGRRQGVRSDLNRRHEPRARRPKN